MIRITLDEDLPCEMLSLLYESGHDVRTVHDQRFTGLPDAELFAASQADTEEGPRWLFTADPGFADPHRYPPGTHEGIVLFQPGRPSRRAFLQLARDLLTWFDLAQHPGDIIVITPGNARVLQPPAISGP